MKEFVKSIMEDPRLVFSVDKVISKDKSTATLIVLFNDNTVKKFTGSNTWKFGDAYRDLRKHKLNLKI